MNLTILNLSKNRMGLPSILALSKGLIHNQPGNDKQSCLRILDLRSNKLGPQAAKLLAQSVQDHRGLRFLNLAGNFIGNDGALALAEMLEWQNRHSTAQKPYGL